MCEHPGNSASEFLCFVARNGWKSVPLSLERFHVMQIYDGVRLHFRVLQIVCVLILSVAMFFWKKWWNRTQHNKRLGFVFIQSPALVLKPKFGMNRWISAPPSSTESLQHVLNWRRMRCALPASSSYKQQKWSGSMLRWHLLFQEKCEITSLLICPPFCHCQMQKPN